jgi:MFS family permease
MARRLPLLVTPGLSPAVWLLQAGVLLNFFGNGLVGPFLVIYLHYVRGIPVATAGLAIGTGGVVATASGIFAGTLIDRFGARNALFSAMVANGIAYASYTQVHATWQAFIVGAGVGVGTGSYGPCVQTLLSSLVRAEQRPAAFSQQRMSAMVGLGIGAMVGGLIAAPGRPENFELLLVLDAATFLGFAVLVRGLPVAAETRKQATRGYAEALRDHRLWLLATVNLVMVSAGIAPMLVLLPAFARGQAHVPATAIGVIFAINTAVIVLAQLQITQAVARRNPMRTLAFGSSLWVVAWLLVLGSGLLLRGWSAAGVIALAMLFYAIGECLYTAIVTPTAASIAPDALRGRYLAVIGFAWQAGFMVGPAGGGFLLDHHPFAFPAAAAAVCILAAIALSADPFRWLREKRF